ncbi:hypothetical protein Sme01_53530 [Sphaerisporangium melleum]|uniref:ABC3 transporter permease protein domain-containing protein n=2 Tax=Sphaerisporangium melleum TaxID=321316 RepID=A0A917R4J3_9ACTN|nr:hypothetical protein GCM10007964_36220 [Sphaerisporangium melleum]GII72877.1 hypothetical protein Sme01_53530 [Sphaerisporangium melleum]
MLFYLVIAGIPLSFLCGSVGLAAVSAPVRTRDRMSARFLIWGAALVATGAAATGLTAWSTSEDMHYDDFGSAMTALAGVYGAALLVLGLGPFVSLLLMTLRRRVALLPRALRPAVHQAGAPAGTAAGVAATMVATAVAVALMIIAPAVTAQGRARDLQGYQPQTSWVYVVALLILLALAGALAATRSAGSERVLRRLGGGSAVALRFLNGWRAAFRAACGTVIGLAAGCVIGLSLAWPMTTYVDWEPAPPRAPFETPWTAIAVLAAGLPVLAAAIATLAPPTWLTRPARASRPGLSASPEPGRVAPAPEA